MNEKVFMDQYQKSFWMRRNLLPFFRKGKKTLHDREKKAVKSVF